MITALYIGNNADVFEILKNNTDSIIQVKSAVELVPKKIKATTISIVVADKVQKGTTAQMLPEMLAKNNVEEKTPLVLVDNTFSKEERIQFLKLGVAELCTNIDELPRILQMVFSRKAEKATQKTPRIKRIGFLKRTFDIVFALTFLICASPVLLLIVIAIKLDSKGPVVYRSKRVGHGYQVFDFLKFRTMRVNADHLVKDMQALNQYENEETEDVAPKSKSLEFLIDAMGNPIDEETYIAQRKSDKSGTFFKVANDPRITKVGRFLRATSLDELPQFVNVLKGDMSIIGNRPLPLYEAEQLTTDHWAARFLAPAGITGLWQVEKRGKADMSETERKELDNYYTKHQSFWYDMRILLKTIPALLQKENV